MPTNKILVIGAGLVAPPCVEYLTRNGNNQITIASLTFASAQQLASHFRNTTAIALDVSNDADLETQIQVHDLIVSLVPFAHHVRIAKLAIKHGKNMVTTSYASPVLRQLHQEAKEKGVTVLNEVGLDPGIDHLWAVKKISEVHEQGGKILEFHSYCGGLPAPECSHNPLKFKFSWSPRGALLSQLNSATFLRDGRVVHIPAAERMASAVPYHVVDGYEFVAYPNRDSVPFKEWYGMPEAGTVVRGSLRYVGNPGFVRALGEMGWLDGQEKGWLVEGIRWSEIWGRLVGCGRLERRDIVAAIKRACEFSSEQEADRIISGLDWMGSLSDEEATVTNGTLLDTLCARLSTLMSFQPGERDLVMLQHKFVIERAGWKKETHTSTLEMLGDPNGHSAMAKCVGVTCGIAVHLLLDGHSAVKVPGVICPYAKEICEVIREKVEKEGITMVERVVDA